MQNYIIYGINGLVVVAAIVGVILGKITWYEAAALAAALLVPSAGHVALSARGARAAEEPPKRKPPIPRLPLLTLMLAFAVGGLGSTCRGASGTDAGAPAPPSTAELIEAGIAVVNSTCTLLEGVTQNLTVVSICATLEEVATIATFVSQFLKRELPYTGAAPLPCTPIPGTEVCATREELGRGIVFVLAKRRARLMMPDAGVRP